ncbi:haloacid dehalogenase-like hydrolase [Prochlorococcus marinus XMU1410]|uniref:HAD family hydrolase n=1 Tax=Prochlorococcus marinus TaxID=1219 RepID=UPI001ADC6DB1|nr:HAD family hydrolase [Prochlorococcus marinus]MBO8242358.1 haloacid dehalogenase-like hydrolase [Prochlorococcus marinus XMU1410]
MTKKIVVFDIDGTLIQTDTLLICLRKIRRDRQLLKNLILFAFAFILWKFKFISDKRCKEFFLKNFKICEYINKFKDEWLIEELINDLNPAAIKRLEWHKKNKDRIILCSASPRLILQPLANKLDVELICTEVKYKTGNWFPKIISPNCKGIEKLNRLSEYLGSLENLIIEAYGDSEGDKELLEKANLPHYKNFSNIPRPYKEENYLKVKLTFFRNYLQLLLNI